ncbi:MAG: hypothetical protein IPL41_01395 [Micropruina sp.]|nr:hypothetical protein [Micropruina sp.]
MIPLENPIDLSEVLTWPQALVAVAVIVAMLIWPQWLNYLQSKSIKGTVEGNGERIVQFMEESTKDRSDLRTAFETFRLESTEDRADLREGQESLAKAVDRLSVAVVRLEPLADAQAARDSQVPPKGSARRTTRQP